jgi:hypothetical protein
MSLRRLLTVLAATVMLLSLNLPSAHAGEAARNCKWYYHLANEDSPWKFQACVKLVHNPTTHTWVATGAFRSSTPGIGLHIITMHLHLDGVGATPDATGPPDLDYNGFATSTTAALRCYGSHTFDGVVGGHAHWPDGRQSTEVYTWTSPAGYRGSC